MTHFRQSTRSQLPAYQYAYGDKTASGVCMQSASDYSPFGVLLDGRSMQGNFYRRGFNGMEKDDEVKGKGNSYDFGARMYDSRVGRWLSRDPLAVKYKSLSPFHFGFNNPIITVDLDGKENKVVVFQDNHGDEMKFINSGLKKLQEWSKQTQKQELSTYAVLTLNLSNDEKVLLQNEINMIKDAGFNVQIKFFNSTDELMNYMNSKNTSSSELSQARKKDLVTDIAIYSHGVSAGEEKGDIEFSSITPAFYGNSNEREKFNITVDDLKKLDKNAFSSANWEIESCNGATPNKYGKSFVSEASRLTNGIATGWFGRSDYLGIYNSKTKHYIKYGWGGPSDNYPTAGLKSDKTKSEKKMYYNGKKL